MTGKMPVIPVGKDHARTGTPEFNLPVLGAKHCHRILHITRQSSGADRMPSPLRRRDLTSLWRHSVWLIEKRGHIGMRYSRGRPLPIEQLPCADFLALMSTLGQIIL
jgi:hypothetical protein